jgi:uncharacterized membrane protein YedE/YeeE
MQYLTTLIAGLLFGIGLLLSGMGDPAKVLNFLDIFGTWDPSLAFVMGGAIAVTATGYWATRKRSKPLFQDAFKLPTATDLDSRLIGGAATFGVGWGLAGFCPGPAITALPMGAAETFAFVAAMLAGMTLANVTIRSWRTRRKTLAPAAA